MLKSNIKPSFLLCLLSGYNPVMLLTYLISWWFEYVRSYLLCICVEQMLPCCDGYLSLDFMEDLYSIPSLTEMQFTPFAFLWNNTSHKFHSNSVQKDSFVTSVGFLHFLPSVFPLILMFSFLHMNRDLLSKQQPVVLSSSAVFHTVQFADQ